MAVLAVVNPNVNGGAQATPAAAAASDTIPVGVGQKYLLEIINTSGASRTITLNDPDASNPSGYKALDRDHDIVLATNQTRAYVIDGTRYRDANGVVTLTPNNVAGVSYLVYGPFA